MSGHDTNYLNRENYMCRVCNKWKPTSQYANKELNNYRRLQAKNKKVTGITAKLRCKTCSGAQVQKLQCEGPCSLWKMLDNFSKTQRTRGGSGWCQECVLWKENVNPGITPTAVPVEGASRNEEGEFHEDEENIDGYMDNESEEDTAAISDHVTNSMAFLNIKADQGTVAETASTVAETASTVAETASNAKSEYTPPHLRGMMQMAPSITSASNLHDTASQSRWSAVDTRRASRANRTRNTAYNANNRRHLRQRVPSISTSTTVPINISHNRGLDSRQTSIAPQSLVSQNSWTKPVEIRKPAVEAAVVHSNAPVTMQQQYQQSQQQHYDYSSDDEP